MSTGNEHVDIDYYRRLRDRTNADIAADFAWRGPTKLNIGVEVCDRWTGQGRSAMRWLGADGTVRDLDFDEMREMSDRAAGMLVALGVAPGDRVFTMLPRVPEHWAVLLGTLKAGAIWSCLSTTFGPDGVRVRVVDARPRVIATTPAARAGGSCRRRRGRRDRGRPRRHPGRPRGPAGGGPADVRRGRHPTRGSGVPLLHEWDHRHAEGLASRSRPPGRGGRGATQGYWERPEASAAILRDNWHWTGDLAHMDTVGYVWFHSRTDDVISSGGSRIGPTEIEAALLAHPAVAEAGVVGKPDPARGHVVKAWIALAAGQSLGDELVAELQSHCKATAGGWNYPREIEFLDELPKTITGNVRRAELRERDALKTKDEVSK